MKAGVDVADIPGTIERGKGLPQWAPLESNPSSFTQFAQAIGMASKTQFHDCWGLEKDLLAMVPQPALAVILLFPFEGEIEKAQTDANERLSAGPDCFFIRQHIGNACGSIAVMHALLNCDGVSLKPHSLLAKFKTLGSALTPDDRGYLLGGWKEFG